MSRDTTWNTDNEKHKADSSMADRRRSLSIVLALTLVFMVVEVVTGLLTNSLSLLADAIHMLTDAGGIALALFAVWVAQKPATPTKTYGYYRWEILAALINAVVLLGSGVLILFEAIRRFQDSADVVGMPMLIVAVIGLIVNLISIKILHPEATANLNVQGAFWEVVKDALGSVGVISAGVIIWTTGWDYADPIASLLISLLIVPKTWHLLNQAVNVLLEGVPSNITLPDVEAALHRVPGVKAAHDVHVWAISSEITSMSAHVVLEDLNVRQSQQVLEKINEVLRTQFDIEHATIQIEHRDLVPSEPIL